MVNQAMAYASLGNSETAEKAGMKLEAEKVYRKALAVEGESNAFKYGVMTLLKALGCK